MSELNTAGLVVKQADNKFFASMIQRQFWMINELCPSNSAYNIISCFDVEGMLDVSALERAFHSIIERYELLRSTFSQNEGVVYQHVHAEIPFSMEKRDVRVTGGESAQSRASAFISKEATRPFDLRKGPLIRAHLLRLDQRKHLLLIVMHHIVVDLKSKEIFSSDLASFYNAFARGDATVDIGEARQYSEYAQWQRGWISSPEATKIASFWEKHLTAQSGILEMPIDYSRPSMQQLKGDSVVFDYNAEFSDKLKTFSTKERSDIYLVLFASYLVLLNKYANQEDITVGVPLTNRRRPEEKDTFGCYVNILPLGFQIAPETSFRALMKQVRQNMLLAHRNQELPFENILQVVKPKSSPSTNPIFQAGFTVEPPMSLELDNLKISPRKIHHQGAQLDIFLSFWNLTEKIEGYFEYNVELFQRETIERVCTHYRNILERVVDNPEITVADLDVLSQRERDWLLFDLNRTDAVLPKICLHQMFETQVERTPNAVAIVCGDDRLTYVQLDKAANQLACFLQKSGVAQETFVGIHLERSIDMMIAVLAVLKANGTYVPLDPAFPANRLNHIVADSDLGIIITKTTVESGIDTTGIEIVYLDKIADSLEQRGIIRPTSTVSASNLAYVLYTSGSTGKPKGIPIHHEAVVNFLFSMSKTPGIGPDDSLLAVTTLSFDISVLELFLPLSVGAKIVMAVREEVANGEALLKLLVESKATVMQATPSTWQLLIAAGLQDKQKLKILCGGESLTENLAEKLCELSESVWNLYGPTETTIWSSCARVLPKEKVNIGRPIDNTQIYIVDGNLNLTPPGVPGELIIGGTGVSRGYLNRPELNREKFISDVISKKPANRLFRTGDLARYRNDGTLEHLGRLDYQIKLRGFRIELGEIENVLAGHKDVKQCAVVLYERNRNDRRLVAYLSTNDNRAVAEDALRVHLRSDLPDYMIPASFQHLKEMPLTDNGKIARNKLPKPILDTVRSLSSGDLPKRKAEQKLLSIWKDLLSMNDIGIRDNFFDVGGNSLLAIEATFRIGQVFSSQISVAEFFQYPTIMTLASYLDNQGKDDMKNATKNRAMIRKRALNMRQQRPRGQA